MTDFTVKAAVYLATGGEQEMAAAVRQIRSGIACYASTPWHRPTRFRRYSPSAAPGW